MKYTTAIQTHGVVGGKRLFSKGAKLLQTPSTRFHCLRCYGSELNI
jgi:hypothetical protein